MARVSEGTRWGAVLFSLDGGAHLRHHALGGWPKTHCFLPQWRLSWAGGDPEAHVPQALPWTLGVLFQHLPGNLASQELREDS